MAANLYIYSESLDLKLIFPAYVTSFQDSFKASYTDEALPFNLDPFRAFNSTTRNINISFDLIGENIQQASHNLYQVSLFTNLLYGTIRTQGNTPGSAPSGLGTKTAPADVKIFYMNFLRRYSVEKYDGDPWSNGLSVKIFSHDFKPEYDSGFFTDAGQQLIYPKLIKMSLNLGAVHENDHRAKTVPGIRGGIVFSGYPYVSAESLKTGNVLSTAQKPAVPPPPPPAPANATQAAAQAASEAGANTGTWFGPVSAPPPVNPLTDYTKYINSPGPSLLVPPTGTPPSSPAPPTPAGQPVGGNTPPTPPSPADQI